MWLLDIIFTSTREVLSLFYLYFMSCLFPYRPDVAYIQKDPLSLPALKQTMGNKAIERRKRTQILHKTRFRREVLP